MCTGFVCTASNLGKYSEVHLEDYEKVYSTYNCHTKHFDPLDSSASSKSFFRALGVLVFLLCCNSLLKGYFPILL